MLQDLRAPHQVTWNRQIRLDRRKELGLFLHDVRESLLCQTVQNFINFLPRDVRARGQLQRFEARMTNQNQIGARFIGVEAQLL